MELAIRQGWKMQHLLVDLPCRSDAVAYHSSTSYLPAVKHYLTACTFTHQYYSYLPYWCVATRMGKFRRRSTAASYAFRVGQL